MCYQNLLESCCVKWESFQLHFIITAVWFSMNNKVNLRMIEHMHNVTSNFLDKWIYFLETPAELCYPVHCVWCVWSSRFINISEMCAHHWELVTEKKKNVSPLSFKPECFGLVSSLFVRFLRCCCGGNFTESWQPCQQASSLVPLNLCLTLKTLHSHN